MDVLSRAVSAAWHTSPNSCTAGRLPRGGSATQSPLPCPGEEAQPRPKSLVGVGARELQAIALGSQRRPWAAVPSTARGDRVLPTGGPGGLWSRPKALVAIPLSGAAAKGTRRPAPECGCHAPALRGDRLPACRSSVDRPRVAGKSTRARGDRPRLVTIKNSPVRPTAC